MPSTFEDQEAIVEDKDYTKWIWLGVIALVCVLLFLMWQSGGVGHKGSVVRARHILIGFDRGDPGAQQRALDHVNEIRQRILDGENFGDLAEQYSMDPGSARRGGDLNFTPRGSFTEAFEAYVWSAPIGQLSDLILTEHGYHLIVVEDRVVSEVDKAIEEENKRIREQMKRDRQANP